MAESIAFDALTAAVTAHYLETRDLPSGLVAWLMVEAARSTREEAQQGVRVTIKGWSGIGDAVTPGGFTGAFTMKVSLRAREGAEPLTYVGTLRRANGELTFTTTEMAFSDTTRIVASRPGRPMRLEIRQQFPETIMNGLTALVGRPLSTLAEHPALLRPGSERIVIADILDRQGNVRSRVGIPGVRDGVGVEVEIAAEAVRITASR